MESPLVTCSKHSDNKNGCEECMNDQEVSVGILNMNKRLLQEKKSKELEIDRLNGLISIAEEKLKSISTEKIKFDDSAVLEKGVPLSEHFASLALPSDFFSIAVKEEYSIAFLIQNKFLPKTIVCQKCNLDMSIIYYSYSGYIYNCFVCNAKQKIRNATCFHNSPLGIEKILLFVFFWVLGVRDSDISNLLEVSKAYISAISRTVRQLVGEEFAKTPPQFSGVVEMDELDFIKRKIEIGKSKAPKKWILVMIERDTRQMYIEYIPERTKQIIIPIIQKYCLPGTTIITKAWAGYGRLEDLGYCHYTYDKTKGFIDPQNHHIHHCNVKNVFTWLKYNIKTKNRAGNYLQEYIMEWLWRKRKSNKNNKDASNLHMLKLVLNMLTKISRINV